MRYSTMEGLSTALTSKNLKLRETRSALDYVIALGMIGIRNKMAGAIISVHLSGNPTSFKQARMATIELAKRLSAKRGWNLDTKGAYHVAHVAWKMYLMPGCPSCTGRKYQVAEGTPLLTTKPCNKCRGTGLRNYPSKYGDETRDVVQALTDIEEVAVAAIRKKLRDR